MKKKMPNNISKRLAENEKNFVARATKASSIRMTVPDWNLLRSLTKVMKLTQGEMVAQSLNLFANKVGIDPDGEVEPETPGIVILSALKFLSRPGVFLDPRVQKYKEKNATCAVACAWLQVRSLCLNPRGQELDMGPVAVSLNINEAGGVKTFLDRLDGDVKTWLTYQGQKENDLEARLLVLKACQEEIKKF